MSKTPSGRGRPLRLSDPVPRNARNRIDGLDLLASVGDGEAALVICDPQYRGVLDKMKFGNEGARQSARAALPQMSDEVIESFVYKSQRILRPSGHFFLWSDKFTIASGKHMKWVRNSHHFRLVDLISWNKTVPGMGRRARCYTEYLIIFQKEPTRAKGVWTDHGIPDSWIEQADKSKHPHSKPTQLTMRLIRAVTKRNDLVVDPCAGGYGVLDACLATGREFLGGDLV